MAATLQPITAEKDTIRLQGVSPDFDSNRMLEEITRNALHATGARGAALVLSDGKVMSCRACSGELAPPVGTRLNPDAGFTATCVQTAEVVRCDDTATDPRIHGSGCIELGIRSILAVPVFDGMKVAGVLEVLSGEPKKFEERHVTALKLLARLVETLVNYASRAAGAVETQTSIATPHTTDSSKLGADAAKVMCLSCGHRNPPDSQFCNRCGVILLVALGQAETAPDRIQTDSSADEGLKEIYKLISEKAGEATWSDIYTRLMGNVSTSAEPKPPAAAKKGEPAKTKDEAVAGLRTARGTTEIKTRLGAAVRRSLWL
jgi:hypothetical protein